MADAVCAVVSMIQWVGDLLAWMESSLPELGEQYGPWLVQQPHPDAVTACVRVDVAAASTEFVLSAIPLGEPAQVAPEMMCGRSA
ncbi:hypothetical protein [Nocardia sp. NPDC050175]|uniref:hypothetical protein n=1 Tax=Nocardia sp. NPDC050175 TaxID=3364317 RepID=UPI0037BCBE8F